MKRARRAPLVWVPVREVGEVGAAYDALAIERAEVDRRDSPVAPLRVFNNSVKSELIRRACARCPSPNVLELAVGTGGDLFKWFKAGAARVVGVDISAKSVATAAGRAAPFGDSVELYIADLNVAAPEGLRRFQPQPVAATFDIVSMQMAFHYVWPTAPRLLAEISEVLKPGGLFVLTCPSAEAITRRTRAGLVPLANAFYSITPQDRAGNLGKYTFWLQDCVNSVVEYLVPFPDLVRHARAAGLELVEAERFSRCAGFTELEPCFRDIAGLYQSIVFQRVRVCV